MKLGSALSNRYFRLTCAALIGLLVCGVLLNLNNPSVGAPFKWSEGLLEIPGSGTPPAAAIPGPSSIPHNESSSDGFTGNAGAESTTSPINHSETLSSNFAGSDVPAKRNESQVLLYRKRRYLLFPEGSSFQLVYDLIIPIVDYTNYAIMGITCAVAWELPSKPPSEIEEDIRDKLNDGTLGLQRNDSIDGIQYVDTKPANQQLSNIFYVQPSEYPHYVPPDRTPTRFSGSSGYRPVLKNKPAYYTVVHPNNEFWLKSVNNRRVDGGPAFGNGPNYVERPPARAYRKQTPQLPPRPKQHAVYHIMGKRSADMKHTDPHLAKLDRIHLRYHRSSRLVLYPKIEAMFNRQGLNGTACTLRALCEVGKRKHETEPGTLLTELFRTVFTLPEVVHEDQRPRTPHPKHAAWDEAYSTTANCTQAYPTCERLLWML